MRIYRGKESEGKHDMAFVSARLLVRSFIQNTPLNSRMMMSLSTAPHNGSFDDPFRHPICWKRRRDLIMIAPLLSFLPCRTCELRLRYRTLLWAPAPYRSTVCCERAKSDRLHNTGSRAHTQEKCCNLARLPKKSEEEEGRAFS